MSSFQRLLLFLIVLLYQTLEVQGLPSLQTTRQVYRHQRQLQQECTDNTQIVNLSLDLHVSDSSKDLEEASCEDEINAKISQVLNDNFPNVVSDWQGTARFGTYRTDVTQANCPPPTDASACNTDTTTCRRGCLQVTTTDCGTSSFTNWISLSDVLQAELLTVSCLQGTSPSNLQVIMQVDDPSMTDFIITEVQGTDDGDDEIEELTPTFSPTFEFTTVPTMVPTAVSLSLGATVAGATVTRGPRPLGSPAFTRAPRVGAGSVTRSPSHFLPRTANEIDDNDKKKEQRNGNNNNNINNQEGVCTENAVMYSVAVDLQINGNRGHTCTNEDSVSTISNAITTAMNNKFTTVVPDWQGSVGFAFLTFDASQDVLNASPGGTRGRRRRLRQLLGATADAGQQQKQMHRALQGSCPDRSDNIACTADYCRWGCMLAPSTTCGINSLTNWVNLGDVVKEALQQLDDPCLGNTDEIQVNLVVVDPNQEENENGAFANEETTRSVEGAKTLEDMMDIMLAPAREEANSDANEENAQAPSSSFPPSKELEIKSELIFTFFEGQGRLPTQVEVAQVEQESKAFFSAALENHPNLGSVFQTLEFRQVTPKYDATANPDEFVLEFITSVHVNEDSPVKAYESAKAIADSDFKKYILDYIRVNDLAEFHDIFKIFFRGRTSAN